MAWNVESKMAAVLEKNNLFQFFLFLSYKFDTSFNMFFSWFRPREENGTSRSAIQRKKMKEENPEKYKQYLEAAKERYRRRKEEREQRWSLGTRTVLAEKEDFYNRKR